MRKLAIALVLLPLVISSIGCKSGGASPESATSTQPGASVASNTQGLKGRWKMDIGASATDKASADMARAMGSLANVSIDFDGSKAFTMLMMGVPVGGSYTEQGDKVHFVPETVLGKTFDEWKKMPQDANNPTNKMAEQLKPFDGTVDQKAGTITISNLGNDNKAVIFKREVPEDESKLASTVKPEEKILVASYKGKMEIPETNDPAKAQQNEMMKSMMQNLSLRLRQDNTFKMNLGLELEGTWSVEGGKVLLKPSLAAGSKDEKPMDLTVSADGKTLSRSEEGKGKLEFTRE